MKVNTQAIKDNLQHIAGLIVGSVFSKTYSKQERSTKFFSTTAVALAQDGLYQWFPYKMIIK